MHTYHYLNRSINVYRKEFARNCESNGDHKVMHALIDQISYVFIALLLSVLRYIAYTFNEHMSTTICYIVLRSSNNMAFS